MGYCAPKGIPLSTFLGWSQGDQDAALAWQAHESRRCRSCGYHPDDGKPHAHIDVCPGCVATDQLGSTDEAKVRGAHLRLAHGDGSECSRCLAVAEMNARR